MYVTHVTRRVGREGCVVRPSGSRMRVAARSFRTMSTTFDLRSSQAIPRHQVLKPSALGRRWQVLHTHVWHCSTSNDRLDRVRAASLPVPRPPRPTVDLAPANFGSAYGSTACASPPRCVARRQVHLQPGLQVQAIELCKLQ